jgi:hypothetical protein
VPVDAELGYLRSLGDLVQCRCLETQFRKEFARSVDDRLSKRFVGGPAAPDLTNFAHSNSSP